MIVNARLWSSVHHLTLKATGNIRSMFQHRPCTLIPQEKQPKPRQNDPTDGPARCLLPRMTRGSIVISIRTRSLQTYMSEQAIAEHTGLGTLFKVGSIPARRPNRRIVISALDLKDHLVRRPGPAVVLPRLGLGIGLLVLLRADNQRRNDRREFLGERGSKFLPVVGADGNAALQHGIRQGGELRPSPAEGVAHDTPRVRIEATVERGGGTGVLRLQGEAGLGYVSGAGGGIFLPRSGGTDGHGHDAVGGEEGSPGCQNVFAASPSSDEDDGGQQQQR